MRTAVLCCVALLLPRPLGAQEIAAGTLQEVRVKAPTRLDWEFAASGFGPAAGKLPAGYDSTKQRYQLFVPKAYRPTQAWPLVLFISPGDQPAGWQAWKPVCEAQGVLFCSPFAAGNNVAAGQRTRIILDVLDDVRRRYRVDPEQTYLAGFSGGGRMACAIGFALPEYLGGVVPICGTNPLAGPTYLRHRLADRLSVAFVTGEKDFNRKENEVYMAPYFEELGVRAKLWVAPGVGHAIPGPKVMAEVYAWLTDDLKRRRDDVKARPELSVASDEAPSPAERAKRMVAAARAELGTPDRTWRGVALLQGAVQRYGTTEAGKQARQLLTQITDDEKLLARIGEQGAEDEQLALSAQAKALERFGQPGPAREAWAILAKNYAGTPVGQQAQAHVRRLSGEALPPAFLGLGLADDGNTIDQLAPQGPAEKAGLKVGDQLTKVGSTRVARPDDLRRVMAGLKPGARVRAEVLRDGRTVVVTIEVGKRPLPKP